MKEGVMCCKCLMPLPKTLFKLMTDVRPNVEDIRVRCFHEVVESASLGQMAQNALAERAVKEGQTALEELPPVLKKEMLDRFGALKQL